ncbi:diadenylate cyclase CdaA [bacterium]|nr:diadenylate cyclase CdaA [bacterium]MBR1754889.1 diadenylate cyclase CdaA [bacterium]
MLLDLITFAKTQIHTITSTALAVHVCEILLITVMVFGFYRKFIKNTQAEKLVNGIVILFLLWLFSEVLIMINLPILGMFLKILVMLTSLSLIVIFQPEMRRFLGYLGQTGFMNMSLWKNETKKDSEEIDILKEIIEATKYLSKTRTGALIVFQRGLSAGTFFEVGTKINADISTELILTIFHPNTPLHDGAMVIKDNRILSAGVLLPLTEDPTLSWKYGTRHRAAIGMSEVTEAACLVVSEETGDVSVSVGGILKKYEDLTTLKNDLMELLGYKVDKK